MKHPINAGLNSITVYQPIVMILFFSFHRELTSTMGPGSRYFLILSRGRLIFLKLFFIGLFSPVILSISFFQYKSNARYYPRWQLFFHFNFSFELIFKHREIALMKKLR